MRVIKIASDKRPSLIRPITDQFRTSYLKSLRTFFVHVLLMSDKDGDTTSKNYVRQTFIQAQFRYEIGRHVKTSRGHEKDVALPSGKRHVYLLFFNPDR